MASTPGKSLCSIEENDRKALPGGFQPPGNAELASLSLNQKMEEEYETGRHHRRDHRIGAAQEG
jgi:hypothetical protein